MTIINLTQNSPEWLEFRKDKIGASDAPIILGVSPYKTPYQLYMEKVEGVQVPQNSAMKRGHDLEDEARVEFEKMYEMLYLDTINVRPCVMQSNDFSFLIASLDGIDSEKNVAVEIKCPGPKDHQTAISGSIPDHYVPQLQHQLFVAGLRSIFYFSYRPGEIPILLEYKYNDELMKKLLVSEMEFHAKMEAKSPPALSDKDFEERFDFEFLDVAMKFASLREELEEKLKEEQSLKNELIRLSDNRNCRGGRVKVSHVSRKGSVDYSKIEELANIDLEIYRKPPTRYSTIHVS